MVAGRGNGGALQQRKQNRRKWLTFGRMIRFGINNFSRNAWLTTAAIAVMTVTLLIIFSTLIARNAFNDTLSDLRKNIDVSIFLKNDITDEQLQAAQRVLKQQPLVTGVSYISKEQARKEFETDKKGELDVLFALTEVQDNPLPASLRVQVSDPGRLDELDAITNNPAIAAVQSEEFPKTLGGGKRGSIDNISRASSAIEIAGLVLSVVAIVISTLIIFNTIRMAIFNRRDEIQMMRLIGADKNFIQGPFIVEAAMYGIIAGIITIAVIYPVMLTQGEQLRQYDVVVGPTIELLKSWPLLVVPVILFTGALIGIVSSFLAIRRYLKV